MPQSVSDALQEYIRVLHGIYGSAVEKIILYGSYARGGKAVWIAGKI